MTTQYIWTCYKDDVDTLEQETFNHTTPTRHTESPRRIQEVGFHGVVSVTETTNDRVRTLYVEDKDGHRAEITLYLEEA